MLPPELITVTTTDPDLHAQARKLAKKLGCSMSIDENIAVYSLILSQTHLSLQKNNGPFKPIYVDFLGGKNKHRSHLGGGRKQDIARAAGVTSKYKPTILDATAGLGSDSFALAVLGCSIHMLERSPILAALLEDALQRAESLKLKLSLSCINALDYLKELPDDQKPDVIYLDPMFPGRKKSALVKKEMRLCRELVGDDTDAPELLIMALTKAKKRVIVKRPRLASTLNENKPDVKIIGKVCRFDIYLKGPNP